MNDLEAGFDEVIVVAINKKIKDKIENKLKEIAIEKTDKLLVSEIRYSLENYDKGNA